MGESFTVTWRLRFGSASVEWDTISVLDLRRADPSSWDRFVGLFADFAGMPADSDPVCWTQAHALVDRYVQRLERARSQWLEILPEAWMALHPRWMACLDDLLGEQTVANFDVTALASISLLAGRALRRRVFGVPFYVALNRQLAICAHETLHFRYFEWLSHHHPEVPAETWDAPHHAWRVSELCAAVVLCDPCAQRLFGRGPPSCYACSAETFAAALDAWHASRGPRSSFDEFYLNASELVTAACAGQYQAEDANARETAS